MLREREDFIPDAQTAIRRYTGQISLPIADREDLLIKRRV
jgi:hypothetical protein